MKAWLDADTDRYGYPVDGPSRADLEAHDAEQAEARRRRLATAYATGALRPATHTDKEVA